MMSISSLDGKLVYCDFFPPKAKQTGKLFLLQFFPLLSFERKEITANRKMMVQFLAGKQLN